MGAIKFTYGVPFDQAVDKLNMKENFRRHDKSGEIVWTEVSKVLGILPQSIKKFRENGKIPLGILARYADKNNISLDWLISPKEDQSMHGPPPESKKPESKKDKGTVVFRHLLKESQFIKARAAAPPPRVAMGEFQEDTVHYRIPYLQSGGSSMALVDQQDLVRVLIETRKMWVEESFGAMKDYLVAYIMESENMEPTIKRNDLVLIDHRETDIKRSGIFAFAIDGEIAIRRIFRQIDGAIDILNDNPSFPSSQGIPLKTAGVNVIGRVVWRGNKI